MWRKQPCPLTHCENAIYYQSARHRCWTVLHKYLMSGRADGSMNEGGMTGTLEGNDVAGVGNKRGIHLTNISRTPPPYQAV